MTTEPRESTASLKGVAETLMITLYSRYVESKREDSILKDEKAVEIAEKIDYDFAKYAEGWVSQLGCALRAKAYDQAVLRFIQTHPKAVIVNLGAGLCTQFFRVDNGEVRWYDIDFPEVIELKRKLVSETERYQLFARSILDFTWIDEIRRESNQPLFIILEGVSMYLTEAQNRALVQQICARLSPAEMILDVLSSKAAKNTRGHDTVSKTSAEFKWGIKNFQELESWESGIKVNEEDYFLTRFADYPQRLPWWGRYFPFILIPLFRNSIWIMRIQIA